MSFRTSVVYKIDGSENIFCLSCKNGHQMCFFIRFSQVHSGVDIEIKILKKVSILLLACNDRFAIWSLDPVRILGEKLFLYYIIRDIELVLFIFLDSIQFDECKKFARNWSFAGCTGSKRKTGLVN